jgi:hypothetical protein
MTENKKHKNTDYLKLVQAIWRYGASVNGKGQPNRAASLQIQFLPPL